MTTQFGKDVVMGAKGGEEHLIAAIFAGILAAAIGAGLWMGVAVMTNWRAGFVALAVGALVGLAVRVAGNGQNMFFGIVGAVLTLAGCLGGEILTVAQVASTAEHDFFYTLLHLDLVETVTTIFNHMDAMMYVIYGVGIFEGYKLSIRG